MYVREEKWTNMERLQMRSSSARLEDLINDIGKNFGLQRRFGERRHYTWQLVSPGCYMSIDVSCDFKIGTG